MRIALVGTRGVPARYGGFETCVEEVGRRLAKAGHQVIVYTRARALTDDEQPVGKQYEGMDLVRLPALRKKSLETLSHTGLSVAHIVRHPVDAAIVFNSANALFLPWLRARRIPTATHVDGLEWKRSKWQGAGRKYYRLAESMAVRWSDALIADAQGIADYYEAEFGAATDLIAYGAPILAGDRSDLLRPTGLEPGGYHLVVGRFEPENHIDVIVDGYRRSKAERPLVVVGSAPYADAYTRRVHALGDDRVVFMGGVWDQGLLDQLYANSFTYLHGHSVGGTNPSLLRAIGAGAAAIAFDVNFNREVLADTGRYFTTAADIATEIEFAELNPAATHDRGTRAQQVAYHYDWDDVAARYEKLCERLVAEGPRPRRGVASRPSGRRAGLRADAIARVPRDGHNDGDVPTVLVAHPSPDVYGSDRQLIESLAGMRAADWAVTVCLPSAGPLLDLMADASVRVQPFPVLRKALLRPLALARLALATPRDLVRIVRTIRSIRPDVVYVNTVTIPLWILAARLTATPVLVHVHEAEEDPPRTLRIALNAPLLLASAVITNSEAARRVLLDVLPRLVRRTAVVPNGLSDTGAEPLGRAESGRLALVARLSPRKGVDVALDAVAILRGRGYDVSLDVCGTAYPGYEWFEHQLRERAGRSDLAGAIRFLGYVSPTAPVLAAASVVLVPSRTEPFGNTAVEGFLARRPVVASAVQGLAEIVTDGRTGLLVPPGDAAALASAIARILDDPQLAQSLAAAGRAEAETRFSSARFRRDIRASVSGVCRQ
jgi:glycosyltransferase involved in cell wall biosynthesis